jgi:hypothetical protein
LAHWLVSGRRLVNLVYLSIEFYGTQYLWLASIASLFGFSATHAAIFRRRGKERKGTLALPFPSFIPNAQLSG